MELVLHIGQSRTGAGFLQAALHENAALLSEAGWHYRRLQAADEIVLPESADPAEVFAAELAPLRKAGKLLLSSPGMANWSAEHFQRLAEHLGADAVTLAIYIRDPFARFASIWRGRAAGGDDTPFPVFFMQHFGDPYGDEILNPLLRLEALRALGPRSSVRLISYDACAALAEPDGAADLLRPLWCGLLGLSAGYQLPENRRHRAVSLEAGEFLRTLIGRMRAVNPGLTDAEIRAILRDPALTLDQIDQGPRGAKIRRLIRHELGDRVRYARLTRDCRFYEVLRAGLRQHYTNWLAPGMEDAFFSSAEDLRVPYYESWDLLSSQEVAAEIEAMMETIARARDMVPCKERLA